MEGAGADFDICENDAIRTLKKARKYIVDNLKFCR